MFVACPHCNFFVAAQSGSTLRCPRCGSAIDPRQARTLETPPPAAAPSQPQAATPPTEAAPEPEAAPAPEATPPPEAATTPVRRKRGMHAPSFVRGQAVPERKASWRGWLMVVALALVLALQLLLAQRHELAASARWRPIVAGACTLLRCELPAWREPTAFTMLQRSVQPRPGATGVLHVNASFRNDARWEQPWPTVMLTLSDMDGRRVGQRAFTPAEYRAASGGVIAPGQSATIELDVVEPARQVVAFSFDFL